MIGAGRQVIEPKRPYRLALFLWRLALPRTKRRPGLGDTALPTPPFMTDLAYLVFGLGNSTTPKRRHGPTKQFTPSPALKVSSPDNGTTRTYDLSIQRASPVLPYLFAASYLPMPLCSYSPYLMSGLRTSPGEIASNSHQFDGTPCAPVSRFARSFMRWGSSPLGTSLRSANKTRALLLVRQSLSE